MSQTGIPINTPRSPILENVPTARAGSWWNQMWAVLLQPARFFRALPTALDTRQWVWMALIILILTGISAARAESIQNESASPLDAPPIDVGPVPGDPFSEAPPEDFGGGPVAAGDPAGSSTDVADSWTTALIASSNIVVVWLLLTILLCEVSLARGVKPRLSHNLQIAVWASVPLGLMTGLQLIYYAAGGKGGEPGLAGLLPEWERYTELSRGQRSLVLSAATRTTLFSLWGLLLVYLGARHTLRGAAWAALAAVIITAVLVVAIPVAAGTIKAPEDEVESVPGGEFMPTEPGFEEEFMPGGSEEVPRPDESSEPAPPIQEVKPAPAGRKG